MNSKNIKADTSRLLQATKRQISNSGVTYYVQPLKNDVMIQDVSGLKKNIFLVTRFLKAGDDKIEFRCDTIAGATYKMAEEKFLLNERFKGHLYEVGEYIAEII